MKILTKPIAAALAAIAVMGASGNGTVERTETGHVLGNPEAEITLTEFVSYTCSHCATFAIQGDGPLQFAYVGSGKLRLEVRPIIRNIVDLTAAMSVNCAAPTEFPQNHTAMMLAHPDWMELARKASAGQQQRWNNGAVTSRLRAVASDLDFYELMERRGVKRTDLDRCYSDEAAAQKLVEASEAAFVEYPDLAGTPSFALNGELLPDTHSWAALQPQLDAQF